MPLIFPPLVSAACCVLTTVLTTALPPASELCHPRPRPGQAWRWARGCSCNENESCSFLLTFGASTYHTCVVLHLSPDTIDLPNQEVNT